MANGDKNIWGIPGWPWELEVLAFIFVVVALIVPFMMEPQVDEATIAEQQEPMTLVKKAAAQEAEDSPVSTWADTQNFVWILVIIGAYIGHLVLASGSYDFVSTPVSHLFAPLAFAGLFYYRLLRLDVVDPDWKVISFWGLGIIGMTALVARIRMARHMLRFRHVDWEINESTKIDASFFELLPTFRPLFYFPHKYRACKEGILIEGWFYIMPIAYNLIETIEVIEEPSMSSQGRFLATSNKNTVEIRLYEDPVPIYISPQDPETLVTYSDRYMS